LAASSGFCKNGNAYTAIFPDIFSSLDIFAFTLYTPPIPCHGADSMNKYQKEFYSEELFVKKMMMMMILLPALRFEKLLISEALEILIIFFILRFHETNVFLFPAS
jgi:hypothetical protein